MSEYWIVYMIGFVLGAVTMAVACALGGRKP
jgi:hypothetical protein